MLKKKKKLWKELIVVLCYLRNVKSNLYKRKNFNFIFLAYNRDKEFQKMKDLVQFNKILKKAGVKDKKGILSKDELDIIDNYEILKKNGRAKDLNEI